MKLKTSNQLLRLNLRSATRANSGSILITSLWCLALLALMASSLSFYTMLQIKVVRCYKNDLEGRYLAQGAIYWTLNVLSKTDKENFQSLTQKWADNPSLFKDIHLGQGRFTVIYSDFDAELGLIDRYGIKDEERKININVAPKEILINLPDVTDEIVDSILDWRDENQSAERKGAEKDYYQDLDSPYPAKDGPIERLEELLLVKGMKPGILVKWENLVTVFGNGKVNLNTASEEVLKCLGLEDLLIEKILEFRKGADRQFGTDDDGVFKEEGSIAKTLFEAEPLSANEISIIVNLVSKGLLGVQSKHFRIEAVGLPSNIHRLEEGKKIVVVVEHVQTDEIKIKNWMEK